MAANWLVGGLVHPDIGPKLSWNHVMGSDEMTISNGGMANEGLSYRWAGLLPAGLPCLVLVYYSTP